MKIFRICMVIFFLLVSACLSCAAENEYGVKAAMLYNFAKFVEWPVDAFGTGNQLVYCIAGKSPITDQLQKMQGKLIKGRTVSIRELVNFNDVSGCQLLFIPESEGARLPVYLRNAGRHGILTVSELDNFVEAGGMVNFIDDAQKIRFDINQEAAKARGLIISSHLLNLGRRVIR